MTDYFECWNCTRVFHKSDIETKYIEVRTIGDTSVKEWTEVCPYCGNPDIHRLDADDIDNLWFEEDKEWIRKELGLKPNSTD